jgi:TonB family protein
MIESMVRNSRVVQHLGGAVLVGAVFVISACATPTPVKSPSTLTIPEDETARYTQHVREQIKKFWGYPCVQEAENNCEYKSAVLDVEIHILASGALHLVKVVRSSGIALYDSYAVNAVRLASPYPPVPPTIMARVKPVPDAVSGAGLRAGPPMPSLRMSARFTYTATGGSVGAK